MIGKSPRSCRASRSRAKDIFEICNHRVVFFAVVGPRIRPPPLDARKKIVEIMRAHGHMVLACGTALQGGFSWIAQPIMTGLARLVRGHV
jgi:hypothetical protein